MRSCASLRRLGGPVGVHMRTITVVFTTLLAIPLRTRDIGYLMSPRSEQRPKAS